MRRLSPHLPDDDGLDGGHLSDDQTVRLAGRPWIGIQFSCCGAYTRIYRNIDGTTYHGVCPRCRRPVTLRVGSEGTDARFFIAE